MGVATRGQILKDSSKYLFFRDSATVYSCYPVNNLVGFSEDGSSGTGLIVYFLPQDRHDSTYFDFVELTVADDLNSDYVAASISGTDGMNVTTTTSQN